MKKSSTMRIFLGTFRYFWKSVSDMTDFLKKVGKDFSFFLETSRVYLFQNVQTNKFDEINITEIFFLEVYNELYIKMENKNGLNLLLYCISNIISSFVFTTETWVWHNSIEFLLSYMSWFKSAIDFRLISETWLSESVFSKKQSPGGVLSKRCS